MKTNNKNKFFFNKSMFMLFFIKLLKKTKVKLNIFIFSAFCYNNESDEPDVTQTAIFTCYTSVKLSKIKNLNIICSHAHHTVIYINQNEDNSLNFIF